MPKPIKIALFANTDWYLYNFRLPLARAIRDTGAQVVLISPPGRFAERLTEPGIRWIEFDFGRRSLNPFKALSSIWHLRKILLAEAPDILHSFTIKGVIVGALAARAAGIDCRVNAIAGLGYIFSNSGWLARVLRPIIRRILRLALAGKNSRLVLQNREDLNALLQEGITESARTRLIRGSGVDVARFKPNVDRSGSPVRILLATRLLWSKGVQQFIDAARALKNEPDQVAFWMAGEPDSGNPDSVPVAQIKEWHESGFVEALGHIDDMALLMRDVHIVALPTTYGEGVPRVLLEASASGLPIVATDTAGCREIVTDGVNGLLVKPGDTVSFTKALKQLINDAELRNQFGRAGRDIAENAFDEKVVIQKTIDVYRELIDMNGNGDREAATQT